MESMEIIFSPRSIQSGHFQIHESKSSRVDKDSHRGQEVLTTELVQRTKSIPGSSRRQRYRNYGAVENNGLYFKSLINMENLDFMNAIDKSESFAWDKSYQDGGYFDENQNYRDDNDSLVYDDERKTHGSKRTSSPVTPRRQLHISHRKCKKRECDVCKPKIKDYHDLGVSIDPVLFTRWEVTGSPKDEWVSLKKIKYKINGLGQVTKSVDKSSTGKVKESTEVIRRKVRVKLDTLKGQKVVARLDHDGLYYPAAVLKCSDPRHAQVKYDNGNEAEVLTRNIIPTGGAVARPKLLVGDYVLMRVVNLDSNDECYVPAIIQVGPEKQQAQARFFTVVMYNGQKASTLRTYLVKISKERFELASMYIAEQQNENRKEVEDLVYVTPRGKKVRKQKRETIEKGELEMQKKEISDKDSEQEESQIHQIAERQIKKRPFSGKKYKQRKDMKGKTKRGKKREIVQKSRSSDDSESEVKEEIFYESDEDKAKEDELFFKRSVVEDESEKEERQIHSDEGAYSDVEEEKIRSRNSDKDSEDEKDSRRGSYYKDDQSYKEESESHRSDFSVNSKRKELEKLQRELQEREEKQERQMRKLKKKAKKLSRLENNLKGTSLHDVAEQEETLGIPVANDATGGMEESSNLHKLLELRKSLQHIRPGEEVLARWSDDGWYYRGIVKHYHGDYSYNLEDSTSFVERIWREDIISENDNIHQVIELDSKVIALHPDFSFSYAPACVSHMNDDEIVVTFYDDKEATLPWNEVYLSTVEKYDIDIAYIIKQEKRLIGASVVARDDKTGVYYPGCVTKRASNGMDYVVSWTDGTQCVQKSIHIFSAFTRRPPLSNGDRVLALADPVHVRFLPGYIIGSVEDNLIVKFCDGETCEGVDSMLCYWLGQGFYDAAVKYYKANDPSFY